MSEVASTRRRGLPVGSASVADKRFRRPDVRPGRSRRFNKRLWRFAAIGAAVIALIALGALATSRMVGSQVLAVKHVVVQGNQRLAVAEIDALIGDVRGQSLLLVNLDAFRARFMGSPWVASVTVRRVLPSTVDVRIVERDPVGIARLGKQLFLVDGGGVIIGQYGPQYADFDLPIVDGMGPGGSRDGTTIDPVRAQLVARFLGALSDRPELKQSVSQMDVSREANIAVLLENDPTLLFLGDDQFVERLRTYLEIRPTLAEKIADVESVDLRYGQRVIVKDRTDRASR